jgi:hypothetical protein
MECEIVRFRRLGKNKVFALQNARPMSVMSENSKVHLPLRFMESRNRVPMYRQGFLRQAQDRL